MYICFFTCSLFDIVFVTGLKAEINFYDSVTPLSLSRRTCFIDSPLSLGFSPHMHMRCVTHSWDQTHIHTHTHTHTHTDTHTHKHKDIKPCTVRSEHCVDLLI